MKEIYNTDISEKKEFTKYGDTFRQIRNNPETGWWLYERTTHYEVVKGKKHKNPDGTIVNVIQVIAIGVFMAIPFQNVGGLIRSLIFLWEGRQQPPKNCMSLRRCSNMPLFHRTLAKLESFSGKRYNPLP